MLAEAYGTILPWKVVWFGCRLSCTSVQRLDGFFRQRCVIFLMTDTSRVLYREREQGRAPRFRSGETPFRMPLLTSRSCRFSQRSFLQLLARHQDGQHIAMPTN